MRYLGSKTSLLNSILSVVDEVCHEGVFCDPFGGIGTVGSFFKNRGYQVFTGDILKFAHCFQFARIECDNIPKFEKLYDLIGGTDIELFLNKLEPLDGWFVDEYSKKRSYFINSNARRIQHCINFIWKCFQNNIISEDEYNILVASLINSIDKVANTAGTYYAYLKEISRKAKKPFAFHIIPPTIGTKSCKSIKCDASDMIKNVKCDVLYLDPPYNERDYQSYYHLPENIASRTIPNPLDNSKSGIFIQERIPSNFNKKNLAHVSFKEMVKNAKCKYLVFHYSDDGLIAKDSIRNTLENAGEVSEFFFDCRAYATKSGTKQCRHHLYRVAMQ